MSISSIISTGTSALTAAQARISVTSTNIANAETTGYTKKTVDVATSVVGGQGTGVQIVGVGNDVDEKLHEDVVDAASQASYDSVTSAYYETVLSAFGSTDDGSEMSEALTALQAALTAAISDPDGISSEQDIKDALTDWVDSIDDLTETIQSTRASADQDIAEDVDEVNALLHKIDSLNSQITETKADGNPTSDLEDSRRTALEELAAYMDVQTFTNSSGEMQIYTSSGQALLTSSVHELSYSASGSLTESNTYESDGSGTISGIMIDGVDCTSDLKGGSIGALVEMRDETLPGLQDEVDEAAETIADALNTAAGATILSGATVTFTVFDSSDTTALKSMLNTLDEAMSFDAAGELPATETTASSYISGMIDDLSDRAEQASDTATSSASTAESLSTSFVNATGVNVDEETALLTTYQQDYQAAARILTTAQDMWDTLLSMMQ